ncbi:MAG: biotin transporter BioY [Lachnospiraceae bacterium]|nr:biotin transporter BioY [Lachnospiraceae bacterium]
MEKTKTQEMTKRMKTQDIVYIAIGVALTTVCSWINIPFTVPFTLQTFAVFAVLLLLGGERGTIAILVYVLMGSVGIPVFAGFKGGFGVIFGNTGGYIIGFIFTGLIYLLFTKLFGQKKFAGIAALVLGLIVCYAFGTAWFMFLYMKNTGPVGLTTVLSWCVFPFIIPDLAKMAVAYVISKRVKPFIKD